MELFLFLVERPPQPPAQPCMMQCGRPTPLKGPSEARQQYTARGQARRGTQPRRQDPADRGARHNAHHTAASKAQSCNGAQRAREERQSTRTEGHRARGATQARARRRRPAACYITLLMLAACCKPPRESTTEGSCLSVLGVRQRATVASIRHVI